jgi:hypothetical protein
VYEKLFKLLLCLFFNLMMKLLFHTFPTCIVRMRFPVFSILLLSWVFLIFYFVFIIFFQFSIRFQFPPFTCYCLVSCSCFTPFKMHKVDNLLVFVLFYLVILIFNCFKCVFFFCFVLITQSSVFFCF